MSSTIICQCNRCGAQSSNCQLAPCPRHCGGTMVAMRIFRNQLSFKKP